jgi:hypothetical protein
VPADTPEQPDGGLIVRETRGLLMAQAATDRVRRPGAGRPALSQSNPALLTGLPRLVDPVGGMNTHG